LIFFMSVSKESRWLHRFALLTAAATLMLIAAGGLVTSHEVGMAVPDWPNTYGYNMFLFPFSKWIGGIFYEHSHRLIATMVGLLTGVLAVWLWVRETRRWRRWIGVSLFVVALGLMGARQLPVYVGMASVSIVVVAFGIAKFWRNPGLLRWLGVAAFAAVILQGVLGGLRVVWFKDEIGIFHGALAQLFFCLICVLALLTSRWWREKGASAPAMETRLPLLATFLILCQLVLGATMRHQHAGLAIPDFPLAFGKLWPAMDPNSVALYNAHRLEITAVNPITAFQIGLQMTHRMMAVAIIYAVGVCAWKLWRSIEADAAARRLAVAWFGVILVQASLGAATIWSNKAADIATAHVVTGAISLALGTLLSMMVVQRSVIARAARAEQAATGHSRPDAGVVPIGSGAGIALSS
jgi:cytochrome c oxidase assembly protein subunit 15